MSQDAGRRMQVVKRGDFADLPLLGRVPDARNLKPEPVNWLVNRLVPEGALVLLAGSPGHYKSWIALDIAVAVCSGGTFANLRTTGPKPVLYIDRENGRNQIANRLEHMGLSGAPELAGLQYWGAWVPLTFADVGWEALTEWSKESNGLLVCDSLVRFHTAKENDNTEMARVMGRFIRLARAGSAVLLLHHASKDSQVKYRGAEEIIAACDVCYHAKKDDQDRRLVRLDQFKNRVAEEQIFRIRLGQDGRFRWEG